MFTYTPKANGGIKRIVSFSGGKDSSAMLIRLVEEGDLQPKTVRYRCLIKYL